MIVSFVEMNRLHFVFQATLRVSRPQPGCHYPNCPWLGIIYLFPTRKTGKFIIFFYSVCSETVSATVIIA
jgi:hypothetical protein